jgi:hypothetical protein
MFAAAGLLAACATATPYQPAAATGSYGYVESRIENNRFRVTFSGNSLTERETVENYLLYRSAELSVAEGYDYFVVANRNTDKKSRFISDRPSYPGFYPDYMWYHPRWGWRHYYDPFWDDTTFREVTRYEASAEIVLGKGPKPAADAHAFDARQVIANLQSKIARPKPAS